jgi:PKD repeat protein
MKKNPSSKSGFVHTRNLFGILIAMSGVCLAMFSLAATPGANKKPSKSQPMSIAPRPPTSPDAVPSGGTLDPSNRTLTYTDGPLVPNPTGVLGAPICTAPMSCSDFVVTVNASSLAATHNITWVVQWTPANVDLDIFVEDAGGNLVANNNSTTDPSAIILPIPANGTVYHFVVSASIGTAPLNGSVSLTLKPPTAPQGAGAPPRYMNYPAGSGQADGDNEPSIGVDWNPNVATLKDISGQTRKNTGGVAFFTVGSNEFRANFDDCSSPAVNIWDDVSAVTTQTFPLSDPIGFVDHFSTAPLGLSANPPQTPGRVFSIDLIGGQGDSLGSYSDTDGNSYLPGGNGGAPAGPDHETLGGGPFHAPIPTPPSPLYPNAIYYCSQNGAQEAECSRSDDGGQTFGPGVPIFDPTLCGGGIHGHVKVSPQGTVYVPNSSCAAGNPLGANGAATSKDNGITWVETNVPGSTGSQDPAVGMGQNNVGKPVGQVPNTLYLGWISGDGHAHAAHSPDEGATWQDDIDVSSIFGIQKAVFPVVVAGDDNRAAYGFLGTDPDFTTKQVWHLYIATTYDGGKSWILIDATPNDPVQIGNVCLLGLGCSGGRNLLDFNGIDVDKEGRALLGYTDGCINCANTQNITQSSQAHGTIARQSGGRRLFAAFDPIEPMPPAAPQILSAVRQSATSVLVSWLEPDNGGSPITGYNVYRSDTSGAEMFLAHVTGEFTLKYLDQAAPTTSNWFYEVIATNSIGGSPYCHELNVNGVQPAETACQAPYITATGPGSPGPTVSMDPTAGELTIQRCGIGEPFTSCTDKSITFQMKVNTLAPAPPPNAIWQILFDVPASACSDGLPHTLFVEATTANNPATVAFSYGWRGVGPTGGSLDQGGPTAGKVTGSTTPDGTITMKLDVSTALVFNNVPAGTHAFDATIPAGTLLNHLQGVTYVLVGAEPGGIGGGSIQVVQQTTNVKSYTTAGNVSCLQTPPIAALTASPMVGAPPLAVTFSGAASSDPNPCTTIASYTLNFGDGSAPVTRTVAQFGANASQFTHTYNSEGDYTARLTVTDSAGQTSNPAQTVVSVSSGQVELVGAVSRKTHGASGDQDLILSLTGPRKVECRKAGAPGVSGADHKLIFVFPNTLSSVGSISAVGTGATQPGPSSGSIGTDTHQYIVNLTGIADGQYITVTLNNVHDSTGAVGSVSATMGVLLGDTNGDGNVDGTDVSQTKSQSGSAASDSTFRRDLNCDGFVDGTDVSFVKSKSGGHIPTP